MRGFERAERRDGTISARIEKRRKSAIADLKQWRRSHGYTHATAGLAQPAVNRAQVLADQLSERLAEAEAQITDLQERMEETRAERMELEGMIEELAEQNGELVGQVVARDAQLAVSKRNILSSHSLFDWLQGPRSGDDGRGASNFGGISFGGSGQ